MAGVLKEKIQENLIKAFYKVKSYRDQVEIFSLGKSRSNRNLTIHGLSQYNTP